MAIRTVVTEGYGNGTFNGTIALVVTRGYAIGAAVDVFVAAFIPIRRFADVIISRSSDVIVSRSSDVIVSIRQSIGV